MTVVESSQRRLAWTELRLSARLVPVAAVVVDLLLLAIATVTAMLGRQVLPVFDARDDVSSFVLLAAGPLLVAWLVTVRGVGGYAREVFGAGTEEYKRIIRASMLCAGLVGIGCYLTSFPLSRGFFLLAFVDRYAAPRPGSSGAQACHPPHQGARPPVRAADHRRGPGSRRRGGGSTAPREVVGLHRSGCAHRAGRACDRDHGRHPRRRPH